MAGTCVLFKPNCGYVADLLPVVLQAWHQYRIPILAGALIICYILVAVANWQNRRRIKHQANNLTRLPAPAHTKAEPTWIEKKTTPPDAEGKIKEVHKEHVESSALYVSVQKAPRAPRPGPRRLNGSKTGRSVQKEVDNREFGKLQPLIFFSSLTGTTERYAKALTKDLKTLLGDSSRDILEPQIHDLSYIDYDDYFVATPKIHPSPDNVRYFYLILLPSYNIDSALDNFLGHLQETHHDFRVDTAPLSGLVGYSVFGFGDRRRQRAFVPRP